MASTSSPGSENHSSLCIRRNERHTNTLFNSFRELFEDESLFDCSIVCEGKVIKGHKFLLAAASPYFRSAFNSFANSTCSNSAIFIQEVPYSDLKTIIDFLYRGEAIVDERQLQSIQKSIESLKVTCLLSSSNFSSSSSNQSVCKASNLSQSSSAKLPRNSLSSTLNGTGNGTHNEPSSLSALINGSTSCHQYIQRQPIPNPNFFSNARSSSSHMLKVITPPSGPAKVIYQPHEPFVQLRELLRRGPSNKHQYHQSGQNQLSQSNSSKPQLLSTSHSQQESISDHALTRESELDVDLADEKEVYLSGEDFDIEISRNKHDEGRIDSDADDNADSDDDGQVMIDEVEENPSQSHVIDMSVNSGGSTGGSSGGGQQHGADDDLDEISPGNGNHNEREELTSHYEDHPSAECVDIDIPEKLLCQSSNHASNSYSVLPLSVSIASSFNSATARAIAASTTLAVASGLLSDGSLSNHHAHSNHHSHHHQMGQEKSMVDADGQQMVPLKRGRGRPPRHLTRDDDTTHKTYKVRPILPSASSDLSPPPGIIISSEPSLNSGAKKKRISLDTLMALKGRKNKLSSLGNGGAGFLASQDNGKNVCPYCPQVYYSNQAMNDHINNVHTGNAIKYTCEICSKEFSWKISLTKHLRNTHREDKPESDNGNTLMDKKNLYINF